MRMHSKVTVMTAAVALLLSRSVPAERAFRLEPVPESLPESERSAFAEQRSGLRGAAEKLNQRADAFMQSCAAVPNSDTARQAYCRDEQARIQREQDLLIGQSSRFTTRVRTAFLRFLAGELGRELRNVEASSVKARKTADEIRPEDARTKELETATERSSAKAREGFDTRAPDSAGALHIESSSVVDARAASGRDPVVPADKRTPEVSALEQRRDGIRELRRKVEKELPRLEEANRDAPDPAAQMAIVDAKQATTDAVHTEGYLNFSIEKLMTRTPR